MKLPEPEALTLCHLSTKHLRSLAASAGLEIADDSRPALLASLKTTLPKESKQQWSIQDAEVSLSASMLQNTFHVAVHRTAAIYISPPQITQHAHRCSLEWQLQLHAQQCGRTDQYQLLYGLWLSCTSCHHVLLPMQGAALGRMKGLLVSHGNDPYLYGGMPHTAWNGNYNLSCTMLSKVCCPCRALHRGV